MIPFILTKVSKSFLVATQTCDKNARARFKIALFFITTKNPVLRRVVSVPCLTHGRAVLVHLPAGAGHLMVVILGQCIEPSVPIAEGILRAIRAVTLPGLLAGADARTSGVLDALSAVGSRPAGVAEALVRDAVLVGTETMSHAAA